MPTDDAALPARGPRRPPKGHFPDAPFPYMRWAKANLTWDEHNLGMSGVEPLSDDERRTRGMASRPEAADAAADLKEVLAARYGLDAENVHLAAGTSHANFTVYLALARGAHVAVETPAYEVLHHLAPTVGATFTGFERKPELGWRIDADSLVSAVRSDTKLIVATDLHNPSGKRLVEDDLELLIECAEAADAHVLVDEVYADYDPLERPTAAKRHARILASNSLTKVHGLGDLRAGWVLAEPRIVDLLASWDDLVHPSLPPSPMADAARYVPRAADRLASIRERAAARIAQVDDWVTRTPRVHWVRPDAGISGFVRLGDDDEAIDGDVFAERLYRASGVRVVPGSFFQAPEWIRLSFLASAGAMDRALSALGATLGELP